jgi:hypothetical protein
MGYAVYTLNCPGCHGDITNDVVFVEHQLGAGCPGCGVATPYPDGIRPQNFPARP